MPRFIGILGAGLTASFIPWYMPWLRANWWQIWPWFLILGIPLVLLWLVVRIIRHAWKG